MLKDYPLQVFSGRANPALSEAICGYLQIEMGHLRLGSFSDGEIFCQIQDNVRGADVFIVQPTGRPANESLMELLIILDAFRRASPSRVCVVMPYMGYARQDRKDAPRVPITAKLVANLITSAGADRLLTIDLHAAQIQGFFDIPVDHLYAAPILIEAIRRKNLDKLVLVSPDAGGVELASRVAMGLAGSMALIDRHRGSPAKAKAMHLIGDVKDRDCILVDDMIDTASTLTEAADLLVTSGASSVRAAATHAILSGSGPERINRSKITELIVTDSIPLPIEKQTEKISVVSVAPLLAQAIHNVHVGESVTSLS